MKFNDWLFLEEFRNDIFNKELINYHISEIFKQIISETLQTKGYLESLLLENEDSENDDGPIEMDDPFPEPDEDVKPTWVADDSSPTTNLMKMLKDVMILYYWKANPDKAPPGAEQILQTGRIQTGPFRSIGDTSKKALQEEIARLLFVIFKGYAKKLTSSSFISLGMEWEDAVSKLYDKLIKKLEREPIFELGKNLSDLDITDQETLSSVKAFGKAVLKNALRQERSRNQRVKVKQQNYKIVLINMDLRNNNFDFYKTYYTTGNLINLPYDDEFQYSPANKGLRDVKEVRKKAALRYRKEIADHIQELSLTKEDLYPIQRPTDENIKTSLENYKNNEFGSTQIEMPLSAFSSTGNNSDSRGDELSDTIEMLTRSKVSGIRPGEESSRDPLGIASRGGEVSSDLVDKIRQAFSDLFTRNRTWALTMCIALGLDCSQSGLPSSFELAPLYKDLKSGKVSEKFDKEQIIEKLKTYGITATKGNISTWIMLAKQFLEQRLKELE